MSSTHADILTAARPTAALRQHRLSPCFALLLACWILLVLSERLLSGPVSGSEGGLTLRRGLFAALMAGTLISVWHWRGALARLVSSIAFSFAVLVALLGMTILGTVVLQGAEPEEYAQRYGALAPIVLGLGLDDLFHTLWFQGFLGLSAVSLVVVAIRRQAWRMPMWGHLACHMGIVTILLGGLIGALFGRTGVIDLHEGDVAGEFVATQGGRPTGERVPLGFALRLDDFEIERREPEYRLYSYTKAGEGYRTSAALDPEQAGDWQQLEEAGWEVRLVHVFPDFHVDHRLREVPQGEGNPALRIVLPSENGEHAHGLVLLAGVPGRESARLWPDGPFARLVWERPSEAELARLAEDREEAHTLRYSLEDGAVGGELAVELGASYALADGRAEVRVLEYLPDFTYDVDAGRATSRSDQPNNPALRVELRRDGEEAAETRWLFARMPDYGGAHAKEEGDLKLVYAHEVEQTPVERELLVVGSALETWELERGVLVRSVPFGDGEPVLPGVPGAELELLASAVEEPVPGTASDEWNHPVAQVELRRDGTSHEIWLEAGGEPAWLDEGVNALVFQTKPDDIKSYRSRLTVVADGRDALTKTIEVNDPLAWNGYLFYQSSYREEDPTYTGLQVVRDPGYPVVFAGFVMIALGLIYVYYMRQRLLRRFGV